MHCWRGDFVPKPAGRIVRTKCGRGDRWGRGAVEIPAGIKSIPVVTRRSVESDRAEIGAAKARLTRPTTSRL